MSWSKDGFFFLIKGDSHLLMKGLQKKMRDSQFHGGLSRPQAIFHSTSGRSPRTPRVWMAAREASQIQSAQKLRGLATWPFQHPLSGWGGATFDDSDRCRCLLKGSMQRWKWGVFIERTVFFVKISWDVELTIWLINHIFFLAMIAPLLGDCCIRFSAKMCRLCSSQRTQLVVGDGSIFTKKSGSTSRTQSPV